MQLSVQLQRALQPKIRLQKGLILNELVQCRRRIDVFEAFTMAESVLQLGLQKMHNVTVSCMLVEDLLDERYLLSAAVRDSPLITDFQKSDV